MLISNNIFDLFTLYNTFKTQVTNITKNLYFFVEKFNDKHQRIIHYNFRKNNHRVHKFFKNIVEKPIVEKDEATFFANEMYLLFRRYRQKSHDQAIKMVLTNLADRRKKSYKKIQIDKKACIKRCTLFRF